MREFSEQVNHGNIARARTIADTQRSKYIDGAYVRGVQGVQHHLI